MVVIKKHDNKGNSYPAVCWRVDAPDAADLDAYLTYLKGRPDTLEFEILDKSENTAHIYMTNRSRGTTFEKVLLNKCVIVSPVVLNDGLEHWRVITQETREVGKLPDDLKDVGEVKVERIGRYVPDKSGPLTDQQRKALQLAIFNGYYEWPRRTNLEELARLMGISRQAYQAHLRKAEAKLLPELLKGKLGFFG